MKKTWTLMFLFLAGCSSDRQNSTGNQNSQANIETPLLVCQVVRNADAYPDNPLSEVYLHIGKTTYKVAEVSVCLPIDSSEYTQYDIPAKALDAVGGWWAGGGDYFYVISAEGEFQVMHAAMDEMSEGPAYSYKTVLAVDASGKIRERK